MRKVLSEQLLSIFGALACVEGRPVIALPHLGRVLLAKALELLDLLVEKRSRNLCPVDAFLAMGAFFGTAFTDF